MSRRGRPRNDLNLAEEVERRNNCRVGLSGLSVRVDDIRETTIRGSHWDPDGNLVISLAEGDQVAPDRCRLAERWPVRCCRPGRLPKRSADSTGGER